jgi:hypothetical protein
MLRESKDLLLARRNMMGQGQGSHIGAASCRCRRPWFCLALSPEQASSLSTLHLFPLTCFSLPREHLPSLFSVHHPFQSVLFLPSQSQQRQSPLLRLLVKAEAGRRKELEGSRDAPTAAAADGPQQTASAHPRLRGHGDRPDGRCLSSKPPPWLTRCFPHKLPNTFVVRSRS